jgi:hypothetical protein
MSNSRAGFIKAFPLGRHVPQGLKPAFFWALNGTAQQAAEKVDIRCPAPEGASDFEELTVSLKRYPDTKPEFFRKL